MPLVETTIDDEMAADWAKIQEKHAVEESETAPVETKAEEPATEPVQDRGDGRRTNGTFAPKAKDTIPEAAAAVDDGASAPIPVQADPAAQSSDLSKPPSTWKPVARAEWDKLSPAIRAEVHRREADWSKGRQELIPDAQLGRSMREVVAPYKALIDAEAGGRPEVAFAELMKTAAILRMGTAEQKRNVVLGVAKQYGVDLSQVTQAPVQTGQPQQTFQDPRVDQLLQHLNQQEQQRQTNEQQQLEAAVVNWMDAKDATGAPKYPYLGDVANEMQVLVPQIRQSNPSFSHEQVLQSAYERATWASPEVRPLLLQAQAAEAARPSDNQNRVREAKRAASVNVPRRASIPSAGPPGTLEDTLTQTARTLGLLT